MCIVSRSTGLTLYLHYEPVGINNWSVVLGVSEGEALAGTRGVVQTLSMMTLIVGAILLSYLGFMVWYLASARRSVYRTSITDQCTGLMNRSAYEKLLHGGKRHTSVPAVCIYKEHRFNGTFIVPIKFMYVSTFIIASLISFSTDKNLQVSFESGGL